MNTESLSQLRQRLLYEGLCDVGFSRIDETVPPDLARYHYAVTLMYRLSDAIVDEIDASPTYAYFQHYRAANALLDRCALITCEFLRREGAAAYPIAASQSVHDRGDKYTGIYQHKSAAVGSGMDRQEHPLHLTGTRSPGASGDRPHRRGASLRRRAYGIPVRKLSSVRGSVSVRSHFGQKLCPRHGTQRNIRRGKMLPPYEAGIRTYRTGCRLRLVHGSMPHRTPAVTLLHSSDGSFYLT